MKSLKIIQTLAKIGKIFNNIVYIFSIVGACLCAVSLVTLPLTGKESVPSGSVKIQGLAGTPIMYACLAVLTVVFIGAAIVCKFGVNYFQNELADGTPFTIKGSKELLRLGILNIVFSVAVTVIRGILLAVASHFYSGLPAFEMGNGSTIRTGIAMIILSLFCRYGAELTEKSGAGVENAVPAVAEEVPETEPEPSTDA